MPSYNKESNTYTLSKLDKFRLFKIKHKSVEGIALISAFVMPFCTSVFAIGWFAVAVGILLWWILRFDNTLCFTIATSIHWIIGIVLGVIGQAPLLIWFIYFPLLINFIYYLICEWLDDNECKSDMTPLEILYKQHKIK